MERRAWWLEMATSRDQSADPIDIASARISEARDADVILFCGNLFLPEDRQLANLIRWKQDKENVFFILGTFGGSANSAYRIGSCLRNAYSQVTVFVPSFCKSAGTLLALAADELVIGDSGELGPLDVQLLHHDVAETRSGLTQKQALLTLRDEIAQSFEHIFLQIRNKTRLSTEIAAKTTAEIISGIFSRIYDRLDPMMIGDNDRAMEIARAYGNRLCGSRNHLRAKAIDTLIKGYPAHDFVIDRMDAAKLFSNLKEPTHDEKRLALLLSRLIEGSLFDEDEEAIIEMLSMKEEKSNEGDDTDTTGPTTEDERGRRTEAGSGEIPGGTADNSSAAEGQNGQNSSQPIA